MSNYYDMICSICYVRLWLMRIAMAFRASHPCRQSLMHYVPSKWNVTSLIQLHDQQIIAMLKASKVYVLLINEQDNLAAHVVNVDEQSLRKDEDVDDETIPMRDAGSLLHIRKLPI